MKNIVSRIWGVHIVTLHQSLNFHPYLAVLPTDEPIGVVRIKIHKAQDLKNVEVATGGKSDPYVRIMSGEQIRAKTEVIDSNLNPVWNEFHYVPVHNIREILVLEVLDWNQVAKDRSLGATELDVRKLAKEVKEGEGENVKIWYEGTEVIDK